MANPTEVFRYPQPILLPLKKDFPKASTSSRRMKRAVAVDQELEVFAAEKYFSGALDKLKPCKTSPENEFNLPRRRHATSSAFWEPALVTFMGRRPPIQSLISCFRRAPPSTEDNENSFRKTSWSTQIWNEKSKNAKSRKKERSWRTATVDPDIEMFSESSSDLFELETLSIRACTSVVEKPPKYSSGEDTLRDLIPAPVEWGLVQAGCWGRSALDVAFGVHKTSEKHIPKKWDSKSRVATRISKTSRLSAPISALSLR